MNDLLHKQRDRSATRNGTDAELESEGVTRDNKPCLSLKDESWTWTHSFYVLMGGFVFDTSDLPIYKKFLPFSRDRFTLEPQTHKRVAELEPSLLNVPSEAEIWDKSKASSLVKAVTCIQAIWFLAQIIFRLSERLNVGLLELNTAAHVLCALVTYYLWWSKPFDIEEPTSIQGQDMQQLCAWLCIDSFRNGFRFSTFAAPNIDNEIQLISPQSSSKTTTEHGVVSKADIEAYPNVFHRLFPGQEIVSLHYQQLPDTINPNEVTEGGQVIHHHSVQDYNRWNLILDGWGKYARLFNNSEILEHPLRYRMRNWPAEEFLAGGGWGSAGTTNTIIVFTLAGLVYGGIHLLAWYEPFHTHVERLLWRISAITIAASGFTLVLWFWISIDLLEIGRVSSKVLETFGYFTTILGILLYLFARTFLVVECFISLPYLPDSSFSQPQWSYYFPHTG